ncbi:hypothetical protein [Sphingomonas alpina]|uniref:Uncharacterized protein n=1 Tax=Sphingomonas alpina TaxID=653931 RepID=A0A7H0LM02_9SPHN|nr:hypothetical protein [Sphingomonas alpina]QNQ10705.1 hypothetical protein H3Z74_05775 [Sphingomonas alpina]
MNWLVFAGSLVAVLVMTLVARLLGLGVASRIADADHARRLAEEAWCGFRATAVAIDRDGRAALLRNAANRHMVLRAHGNHFVSRFVDPPFQASLDRETLTLALPEAMFGTVTLDLGDEATAWAAELVGAGQTGGRRDAQSA